MAPSSTHLVLIPSFNPGERVFSTVRAALDHWAPVWIVVDGSTDHSELRLAEMAASEPNLRV
jgi:glycosyltransferase involved in cell wall biosynthesis